MLTVTQDGEELMVDGRPHAGGSAELMNSWAAATNRMWCAPGTSTGSSGRWTSILCDLPIATLS